MWFKILIVINLLLVVISLFSGAIFLVKGRDNKHRLLKALTTRVVLSITLVCLLIYGFYSGELIPHRL